MANSTWRIAYKDLNFNPDGTQIKGTSGYTADSVNYVKGFKKFSGATLTIDWTQWHKRFGNHKHALSALTKGANEIGRRMVAHAKSIADWTDRSGRARGELHYEIQSPNTERVTIALSHGVFYGEYLENGHRLARGGGMSRKFPVIQTTLDRFKSGNEWQKLMQQVVERQFTL